LKKNIAVIGATGNLGKRKIKIPIEKEANVKVVVRHHAVDAKTISLLENLGAKVVKTDFNSMQQY